MPEPLAVDMVVLDVDGVLIDVSVSYRRAIVETVRRECDSSFTAADVQAFKEAGGFNNDWDLTAAAALYALATDEGLELSVAEFTAAVADRGGGLEAAEAEVATHLDEATLAQLKTEWSPEHLRRVFQALYLGSDRYRELEGADPPVEARGYVEDEEVLLQPDTLEALATYELGVLTGRPRDEAAIALERAGVTMPEDRLVAMEDWDGGKPDPDALVELATAASANAVCYVGDTRDDIRTALNAAAADPERTYHPVGVLTGGLSGDRGRRLFKQAGAKRVLADVNELPAHLTPIDR